MGEPRRWYLIAYDIHDSKRWRKVYELIRGYGERLQLSVFRCLLDDRQREKLRWEVTQQLAAEDSLLVLGLCNSCVDRVRAINPKQQWPDEPAPFKIL
jgi:CRISPR-associated protein Cas2